MPQAEAAAAEDHGAGAAHGGEHAEGHGADHEALELTLMGVSSAIALAGIGVRQAKLGLVEFMPFDLHPDAPRVPLPDLPDFITTHFDPFSGEDNSADIDAGTLGLIQSQVPPMQIPQPTAADLGQDPESWQGAVSRNAPCPCGSGRKYKQCHGAA